MIFIRMIKFRLSLVLTIIRIVKREREKTKWGCCLVWRATLKNGFANFSAHGGPFCKPIFALKRWD